jgi:predicted RNase H-like nuclease
MKSNLPSDAEFIIVGIDIAWGEKSDDGLCVIRGSEGRRWVAESLISKGDEALIDLVRRHVGPRATAQVAVDGPVICHNTSGARPVDRETHRRFGSAKCGCYPANLTLCPRPARIAGLLSGLDLPICWDGPRALFEVYPHPAIVRWGGLKERIPYKKGRVEERRKMFEVLQGVIREIVTKYFPALVDDSLCAELLVLPWSKAVEDRTDALICALIGLWHWEYRGSRTERLGDAESGFLLVPSP